MNAPDTAVHSIGQHQSIPLVFIQPSPTNPRKHFDEAAHNELTASVRKHGVIQPILVRAGTSPTTRRVLWEIVAGERRYRAAAAAGLEEIPAIVRELSDVEALEIQVIENLQREGLHPLEEAEGYELLMQKHGYTADDLAVKVGKSKAYIYARLKLCALPNEARKAFYAGTLNPSTALLVARIPNAKLQLQAVKELTAADHRGDPMPVRQAAEHIQRTYMLRLAGAPFKIDDAELLPKAGACTTCPKRSGNAPELFADVTSADVCTDTDCFQAKREAMWTRAREKAIAEGKTVISGKEAKAIRPQPYSPVGGGYRALDDTCFEDPKHRTIAKVLGKAADKVGALLEDPHTHELRPIVSNTALAEALKAAGLKVSKPKAPATSPKPRPESDEFRFSTQVEIALLNAIRAAPESAICMADFAEMALTLANMHDDLARWGFTFKSSSGHYTWQEQVRAWLNTLDKVELTRFMLECALCDCNEVGIAAAAERRNIDIAAIKARVIAEEKAKLEPKPAAAKKPTAKKPAAKKATSTS